MITKIFNKNEELLALVKEKDGVKYIDFEHNSIVCEFNIDLPGVSIIKAWDINAFNITAEIIVARNIIANGRISYCILLFAYNNIKCKSYKGTHNRAIEPICLEGELKIIKADSKDEIVLAEGKKFLN